ncbi:MAG: hypothetical protein KDI79_27595 [Anaerolineae bacterium]|nr:hypothetical protein [Anaerolineae bacterium]
MSKQYNSKNIRTFLTEGFSTEELRRLCYEESDFKAVYDQLSQNTGKTEIIALLLEYAENRLLMEKLLTLTKNLNPARYENYQPYFGQSKTQSKTNMEMRRTKTPIAIMMDALEQNLASPEDARFFAAQYSRSLSKTIDGKDGFQAIITKIVMYCDARGEYDELWALIYARNPATYQKYHRQFLESSNE